MNSAVCVEYARTDQCSVCASLMPMLRCKIIFVRLKTRGLSYSNIRSNISIVQPIKRDIGIKMILDEIIYRHTLKSNDATPCFLFYSVPERKDATRYLAGAKVGPTYWP